MPFPPHFLFSFVIFESSALDRKLRAAYKTFRRSSRLLFFAALHHDTFAPFSYGSLSQRLVPFMYNHNCSKDPLETYPRLELRDLEQQREQFTLFILAWDKIRKSDFRPVAAQHGHQGMPFASLFQGEQSFDIGFHIRLLQAGIHGMPYARWM